MGIFSTLTGKAEKPDVTAEYAPRVMGDLYGQPFNIATPPVTRDNAMELPALARCRNLIAGTVAGLPLELIKNSTGEEIEAPVWLSQPSVSQPLSVTLCWTVDSLFFYGFAIWEVTESYYESGRPSRFQWVNPERVSAVYNRFQTEVLYYTVDGEKRPSSGNGSLITFQGLDEGLLNRGSMLIRGALDTMRAATIAVSTPQAAGYLKNSGADLPEKDVQGLLAAWRNSRMNRSVAYLTSTLDYKTVGFSPKDMGYTDLIQNYATEIARACNVPAYYVSAEMNNSLTYSNVMDERKQFLALSLQPYICAIEDRLSMDDLTPRTNRVRFNVNETFLRSDPMERLLVTEKLLSLGLITTEQAMEMEDLTPNGNEGVSA